MDNKIAVKLTKSIVDKINPVLDKDQVFYRDENLKGFALRVTSTGMKSFVVETRIEGKVKRITLGKYGVITVEEARKQANAYSDENEHPFWSNVNTCYFNALSQ